MIRAPIATPLRHRWRTFCTGALPAAVFLTVLAGIAALWRDSATAPTLVAEAEARRQEIGSDCDGRLTSLRVELFQAVKAGEVLGHVTPAATALARSTVAALGAELDALHKGLTAAVDRQRLALDFHRLQLDVMRERAQLAALEVQLAQAEIDWQRLVPLHGRGLVSEEVFAAARGQRDRLGAQVAEQRRLVDRLGPAIEPAASPVEAALEGMAGALRAQEEKLRQVLAQLEPIPLVAPIDGVVAALARQEGEVVRPGLPILTITGAQPLRLVGYLRQPLTFTPAPGHAVEVRTRGADRRFARATALAVGHVLEPLPPAILTLFNRVGAAELGLRVHFSAPAELALRPGELVDVQFTGEAERRLK